MSDRTVDVLSADRYELGEAARWVDDRLVWSDIPTGRLLHRQAGKDVVVLDLNIPLGAATPLAGDDATRQWLCAAGKGFLIAGAGAVRWVATAPADPRVPFRMNDACADSAGRVWAGSMASDQRPGGGALHRLDTDGTVHQMIDGLGVPNGPVINVAGDRVYLADSSAGIIHQFELHRDGSLSGRRPFVQMSDTPDGMCVDADDHVWVALYGGSAVVRYDPNGAEVDRIDLPATNPTSPCLGGPDGRTLFITSARQGLDSPSADEGAVLAVPVSTPGLPTRPATLTR